MGDILVTPEMRTTSLIIAKTFGKEHRNILRAIDNLEYPEDFKLLNYEQVEFTNESGATYRAFEITRDGFSVLCMGFTGEKAAKWKLSFLKAFNMMEMELLKTRDNLEWKAARLQGKAIRRNTTDTIKEFVDYATAQGSKSATHYYANITRMEYKALRMLEQRKSVNGNFRDTLDIQEIGFLQVAESIATLAIQQGMDEGMNYRDIYTLAKQRVIDYADSISWVKLAQQKRLTK